MEEEEQEVVVFKNRPEGYTLFVQLDQAPDAAAAACKGPKQQQS